MNVGKRNQRSASLAHRILTALVLGIMALGASVALAEDGKVYAGAECRALSGTVSTNSRAAVFNPSTSNSARVICPIVHDTIGGTQDNISSAVVTVIDANNDSSAQSVSCRLLAHLRKNGGWFGTFSSAKHSSNGDPVTLNFGSLGTSDNHHYYFRCTLPPRDQNTNSASYIVSYRLNEQSL